MSVDGCASSSVVSGFLVEFTNPVIHERRNTFYEVQPQLLYWHNADEIAGAHLYNGLPGHLVTVDDADEAVFIASLVANLGGAPVWTAGRERSAGVWAWEAGPSAGQDFYSDDAAVAGAYTNWQEGQPAAGQQQVRRVWA